LCKDTFPELLAMVRFCVIIAAALLECTLALDYTAKEWLHMVALSAAVEEGIFETATHFAMIAADLEPEINKKRLQNVSSEFENAANHLRDGDGDKSPAASTIDSGIVNQLNDLDNSWNIFKKLINDNVNSITSKSLEEKQNLLTDIDTQKRNLCNIAREISLKYVHKSNENGGPKSVRTLMYSVEQIMVISLMTNDLIFTSLQINKKENITASIRDFNDRHAVLLAGDSLNGIPIMSDVCKLLIMRDVTYLGDKFTTGLTSVIGGVSSVLWAERATAFIKTGLADAKDLLQKMKKVEKLVIEDNDDCKPTEGVTPDEWKILIEKAGLQRVLSQKSVRLFANLATKVKVSENKVELVIALDQAELNLNDLLFGNKGENVASPISNKVAEGLKSSKILWDQMGTDLRAAVSQETADISALTRCSRLSDPLLVLLNEVMSFFVAEAATNMPSLQAEVIDIAGAQLVKICKLCKESMLAALNIDKIKNEGQMSDSVKQWRNSHDTLLHGGIPRTNMSSGVNKTTSACLLQQMQEALDVHVALEKSAFTLVKHNNNSVELHQLNLLAYAKMFDAVTMYSTIGTVTCELRTDSVDEFKSFLFAVGELRVLIQRVQKEFLSNAVGLTATIAEISKSFECLVFGEKSKGIKAAPTQEIADNLFDVEALWLELKSALETSTAIVTPDSLSSKTNADAVMTSDKIEAIMEAYVTLTEEKVSVDELHARRVNLASRQRLLIEQMAKLAILNSETSTGEEQLRLTMTTYESAHDELIDQTHAGRDDVLKSMETAQTTWTRYKTLLLDVADGSKKHR
jgi:hypothetical protein